MTEKKYTDYIRSKMNPLFFQTVDKIFAAAEEEAVAIEDYTNAALYRDLQKAPAFRISWNEYGISEAVRIIQNEEICQ